jgi:hypothetical protein
VKMVIWSCLSNFLFCWYSTKRFTNMHSLPTIGYIVMMCCNVQWPDKRTKMMAPFPMMLVIILIQQFGFAHVFFSFGWLRQTLQAAISLANPTTSAPISYNAFNTYIGMYSWKEKWIRSQGMQITYQLEAETEFNQHNKYLVNEMIRQKTSS